MGEYFDQKLYADTARKAAAEGCVLLRNENGALPLKAGEKIAVFGRNQFNYYKSGTGSGGMVNTAYVSGIMDALEKEEDLIIDEELRKVYRDWVKEHPFDQGTGWAQEPWFQEEMVPDEALVEQVCSRDDAALVLFGRTAGEDKDNKQEAGSLYLTDKEKSLLMLVCRHFKRTAVLLNVGNIIDMSWVEEYKPAAVLYVWQGGQEGGNGVADVLTGRVSPCGKLPDTIAASVADHYSTRNYGDRERNFYAEDIYVGYRYFETFARQKVLYPFGMGLSYTEFAASIRLKALEEEVIVEIAAANMGSVPGKEVYQVYLEKPQGKLGQPARVLVGFIKTKELAPDEEERLILHIPLERLASFDDSGVSGFANAWVMEEGDYRFYVGTDVRSARFLGTMKIGNTFPVRKCEEALMPVQAFERLRPLAKEMQGEETIYEETLEAVPLQSVDPMVRRAERIPAEIPQTGDKGYRLKDVADGIVSMDDFIAQLDDEDLCAIVRGEGMNSSRVTPGTAGAIGGVSDKLNSLGIPAACCSDGPSGIRMDSGMKAFSIPCGTALAATFNPELVEKLFVYEGMELRRNKIETLLGPGMNIHRNPMNGRNFEYFSEDPLLTGMITAAQLRGMHKSQTTGTIKHFACNNQEYHRNDVDAIVSARALREIYLKGFEIAVREGGAKSIMSTYSPLNGTYNASNYDLLTTVLRRDWGFQGIVMTDWWAQMGKAGNGSRQDTASMVRAQNDLYMVVPSPSDNPMKDNSMESLLNGTLLRGELQQCAANICRFVMESPALAHSLGIFTALDRELEETIFEGEDPDEQKALPVPADGNVDVLGVDLTRCHMNVYRVDIPQDGKAHDYVLRMRIRAGEKVYPFAQLSITVYCGRTIERSVTIAGREKEWQEFDILLTHAPKEGSFVVKLFPGDTGMEMKELVVAPR